MKKIQILLLCCAILLLAGCREQTFERIDSEQDFIASVNILEPSLTFYNTAHELIATWPLEKSYTGATLIGQDAILLYGHQLQQADLYQISTGSYVASLKTGIGVTNAYYDERANEVYVTNSKTNMLTSFSVQGEQQKELKLRNYPMSMTMQGDDLYVVNYKDSFLSVIDTETFQVKDEWPISTSSQGVLAIPETNELWVGGHGKGNKPNEMVQVLDITTGTLKKEISVPLMPITFAQQAEEVIIASHGSNTIYSVTKDGKTNWQHEIAANPFAIAYFNEQLVVAGYDDQTMYFMDNQEVHHTLTTQKGPFQLLVREAKQ